MDCLVGEREAYVILDITFARARKGISLRSFKEHLNPWNAVGAGVGAGKATPVLLPTSVAKF